MVNAFIFLCRVLVTRCVCRVLCYILQCPPIISLVKEQRANALLMHPDWAGKDKGCGCCSLSLLPYQGSQDIVLVGVSLFPKLLSAVGVERSSEEVFGYHPGFAGASATPRVSRNLSRDMCCSGFMHRTSTLFSEIGHVSFFQGSFLKICARQRSTAR